MDLETHFGAEGAIGEKHLSRTRNQLPTYAEARANHSEEGVMVDRDLAHLEIFGGVEQETNNNLGAKIGAITKISPIPLPYATDAEPKAILREHAEPLHT